MEIVCVMIGINNLFDLNVVNVLVFMVKDLNVLWYCWCIIIVEVGELGWGVGK